MTPESTESVQTFDAAAAKKAQRKLCREKDYPFFAPLTGICFRCKADIFQKISVEYASTHLITGCPICHKSYVS